MRDKRDASPNILSGLHPLVNAPQYVIFVLFHMVKTGMNDGLGLIVHQSCMVAGLPRAIRESL